MGHSLGRNGVREDLYKRSIFGSIWWNKMAIRVNLSFWLANFQNLTYLKLGSYSLKLYRIVNNNGFSKLSTFKAVHKPPVAAVVIQRCYWNHVGKLLFHKISTILFVVVPLIFICIQVRDSGSQEPLVNISVIMTYNLEQVILFCIICITPWYDRSVTMLRTKHVSIIGSFIFNLL
jgi:hypothetical protein